MTISSTPLKVIVIGGGIAGLTLALALNNHKIRVDVYERNNEITEVGAGLALGANSAKIIEDLGLKNGLDKISTRIGGGYYRKHDTNEVFYFREGFEDKLSAYTHRADFVKLLAESIPKEQIHLGHKLLNINTIDNIAIFETRVLDSNTGDVSIINETCVGFDILIGADGIHSKVRSLLFSKDEPVNSNQVMYRDVIDTKDLKGPFEADLSITNIWLGPGERHIVTFPIDENGKRFAAAAVVPVETTSVRESWKTKGDIYELVKKLDGFHPDVINIFKSFKEINIYGLFDRENLPTWVQKNVLLIGDAAHPGQPHQGANAGQAIEDAYVLSFILKYSKHDPNSRKNINKWLRAFEYSRKAHAEDVVLTSRRMGYIFNKLVASEKTKKLLKSNYKWFEDHDTHPEIEKAIYKVFGPDLALSIDYYEPGDRF